MIRHHLSLLLLFTTLHLALCDMELDDLNDDSYTLIQGNPKDCPEKIRFNTESSPILATNIQINDKTDCTGTAQINLSPIDAPQPADASPPVRFLSNRIADVERFYVGQNSPDLTCGPHTYPAGTEWIFFNPEEELDDVKWIDVYGKTPTFAVNSKSEVDLDDDERYLLLGDLCFYQDSSFTDDVCFPSDAVVELDTGVKKPIDTLVIGDRVHVGGGIFSPIFAWTHKTPRHKFRFIKLTTEDGKVVTATGSHYIYADGHTVQMKDVTVGMYLRLADGAGSRVVAKGIVVKEGLYNPQTTHGDIVVDGIVATTYTAAVQPEAAHALLAPVRAAFHAFSKFFPIEQATEV